MSNFERLCKLYKKEKKPTECKEIVRLQKELLKKAQEEAELKRKETERLNEKILLRRQRERELYAKNREKVLERRRLYYNNKLKTDPKNIEYRKKYKEKNKTKINEYQRKKEQELRNKGIKKNRCEGYFQTYYQRNKEKIKLKAKKYYEENKEKARLAVDKWYYHNRRNLCAKRRKIYAIQKLIKKVILKRYFYYLKNVS